MNRCKFSVLTCLGVLSLMLLYPTTARSAQADQDALQGTWVVTSLTNDGDEVADLSKCKIELSHDHMVMTSTKGVIQGRFKIDVNKSPKHLDFFVKDDDGSVMRFMSIYRLDGDKLTICESNRPDDPRPTEFKSVKGSKNTLMVLVKLKEAT